MRNTRRFFICNPLLKEKIRTIRRLSANNSDYTSLVHLQGLEPWAHWLRVSCSTNWAKGAYICGAWHRFMYRRGAPHRLRVVIHPRFEPGTPWLKVTCSANWANGPKNGGWGGRIWTYECGNQNPVPYRLATPQWPLRQYHSGTNKVWGGRQVSNLLPPEPQSGALPIELRPP